MRCCRYLIVTLFLATGCSATSEQEYTDTDNPASETLLAQPPGDWIPVYQLNNQRSRISEYVPPSQTRTEWNTKMFFESYKDLVDADPITILLREVTADEEECEFVQHFNLFSGLENNYPTSLRLYMCGRNKTSRYGEVKMVKAIQGNEYFYIIRLVKHLDPFQPNEPAFPKEEIARWSSLMKTITVCDDSLEDHTCP